MLLVHHRDSLGRDETTDIFYRSVSSSASRVSAARRSTCSTRHSKRTRITGRRSRRGRALRGAASEWEQVIHYKKQILDVADDLEERSPARAIGDLWQEKVKNQQKAIEAYAEATASSRTTTGRSTSCSGSYQQTQQWEKAIEHHPARQRSRRARRRRRQSTPTPSRSSSATSSRTPRQRRQVQRALDLDRRQLKAFEAINKILTQKKDWKRLERAFRKMVRRDQYACKAATPTWSSTSGTTSASSTVTARRATRAR